MASPNTLTLLEKWFATLDYSKSKNLNSVDLAMQISARVAFFHEFTRDLDELEWNEEIENKLEGVEEDLYWETYAKIAPYVYENIDEWIELNRSLIENSIGKRLPGVARDIEECIRLYKSILDGTTLNSRPLNCALHDRYWDMAATTPIRPYSLGEDLLWRRIYDSVDQISGIEKSELSDIFPEINQYGKFVHQDDPHGFFTSYTSHRKANPLRPEVKKLIGQPVDDLIDCFANDKFRSKYEKRITIDFRFPDKNIINEFKNYLKAMRKENEHLKRKNYTENLVRKILNCKTLEWLDLKIIACGMRIPHSDIALARIAFQDNNLNEMTFNQNIKPLIKATLRRKFDTTLMSLTINEKLSQ